MINIDQQFAQVREALHPGFANDEEAEALAALSVIERHVQNAEQELGATRKLLADTKRHLQIAERERLSAERHVQDMESAIEEWAFDQGYDSLSSESIVVDIRNRAAALPAREKGAE